MIDRLLGAFERGGAGRTVLVAVVLGACTGAPGEPVPPPAALPAHEDGAAQTAQGEWRGRRVAGLPDGARLWDMDVDDSGVFVAIGTIGGDYDSGLPLLIWRSEDGLTWQQVFRRQENLVDPGDASGLPSEAAVAAYPDGFVVVGGTCPDHLCEPLALHSPDGEVWHEVEVPVRSVPAGEAMTGRAGDGAGGGSPAFRQRLLLATPDYTLEGAEMLDVVAAGSRLVAVGWAGGPQYSTANAAWHSDDGGRTWSQAPEDAFPERRAPRDELNRVVRAGDRLVAGGGNRCCHIQAVGEVWVSDTTGERWRPVSWPDGESITISQLAAAGDAVHVLGWEDGFWGQPVHWRLAADGGWERLPGPPLSGRLLAHRESLLLVAPGSTRTDRQRRLTSFHLDDGGQFRLSRASAPREALGLEQAVVVDDRLFAYVTAGQDRRRLLFEAPAGEVQAGDRRAVWAARVDPSPVLFGAGVRLPDGDGGFVDVTPAEMTGADLVVDAFFLDEDHGWALLADSETGGHRLLATTDGGAGWVVGGFAPSPGEEARHLSFTDDQHGWIVAYPATQSYPEHSSLYRTGDGGRTWTGPSPLPGCGPVHFDTPAHGWLADPGRPPAGCGLDHLHETTDGGKTWVAREVVARHTAPVRRPSVRYGPPRFGSRLLPAMVVESERSRAAFFESDDEGRTWELTGTVEFEGSEFPQASIADEDVWWAADAHGSRLAVTSDGGAHWRRARPEGIRGRLVSLQGVDDRRAWGVDSSAEGVRLVETLDGGATWRPLLG